MDTELDLLRKDLKHQLRIPDELDWDYFLETARKAKCAADKEKRNMTENDPTFNGWTKTKDGFPKVYESVLIYKAGVIYKAILIEGISGYYWANDVNEEFITNVENVFYWMKLPEPPY